MVKRLVRLKSYAFRAFPLLVALSLFFFSILIFPSASVSAATGNGSVYPRYFPAFRFDNLIWEGGQTGFNYYLDWALNEFADPGYNQTTDYVMGNELMWYSTAPFLNDATTDPFAAYNFNSRNYFKYNVTDSRSVSLEAYQMVISSEDLKGIYSVRFGDYGQLPFRIRYSFIYLVPHIQNVNGSTFWYLDEIPVSGTFVSTLNSDGPYSFYEFDFADWFYTFTGGQEGVFYLRDVQYHFEDIGDPDLAPVLSDGVSTYREDCMWINADVYAHTGASPTTFQQFFDWQDIEYNVIEGPTYVTDFPTDWTGWLANVVGSFMDFEFVPGLSFGAIFFAILGVLIVWFILHLFM